VILLRERRAGRRSPAAEMAQPSRACVALRNVVSTRGRHSKATVEALTKKLKFHKEIGPVRRPVTAVMTAGSAR